MHLGIGFVNLLGRSWSLHEPHRPLIEIIILWVPLLMSYAKHKSSCLNVCVPKCYMESIGKFSVTKYLMNGRARGGRSFGPEPPTPKRCLQDTADPEGSRYCISNWISFIWKCNFWRSIWQHWLIYIFFFSSQIPFFFFPFMVMYKITYIFSKLKLYYFLFYILY